MHFNCEEEELELLEAALSCYINEFDYGYSDQRIVKAEALLNKLKVTPTRYKADDLDLHAREL